MEPFVVKHVNLEDLPVSCPPSEAKWDLHPRVYLPICEDTDSVDCPYCGTRYVLKRSAGSPQDA